MRVELHIGSVGAENGFPGSRQRQENTLDIVGRKKVQCCWRVEHGGRISLKRNEAGEISRSQIMESLLNLAKELGKKHSKKGNI